MRALKLQEPKCTNHTTRPPYSLAPQQLYTISLQIYTGNVVLTMKKTLAVILVACVAIVVAFAFIHHHGVEQQRQEFDASSPLFSAASQKAPASMPQKAVPSLVQQLPAGAHAVIFANLASFRNTPFANEVTALAPTPAQDPSYMEFVRGTGFDYSLDLDRVAIAVWPQNSPTSILSLSEGRFDEQKIQSYAMHNGARRLKIRGYDVFEIHEPGSTRLVRFTFLNPDEIAIADGPALSEVLGAPVMRLDSQMSARVAAVSRAPIYAVARSENLVRDIGIDMSKSAQLSRLLQSVHVVTAAGEPVGKNLNISAAAECDSSMDALELSTMLQGLLYMGRAALADSRTRAEIGPQWPALEGLLQAADISHHSNSVRLRLQITPEILRAAAGAQQKSPGPK